MVEGLTCSRLNLPFQGSLLWFLFVTPAKGRLLGTQAVNDETLL